MAKTVKQEEKRADEATRFSSDNQPDSNGRHLLFETVEELQAKIDDYFKECNERIIEVYDKKKQEVIKIVSQIPYTIEGLCDSLGCRRHLLIDYDKKARYSHTVEKAKSKILRNKMERGLEGQNVATVALFDLKNNYAYKDQTEVKQTGRLEYSDMSEEQLDSKIEQKIKELEGE